MSTIGFMRSAKIRSARMLADSLMVPLDYPFPAVFKGGGMSMSLCNEHDNAKSRMLEVHQDSIVLWRKPIQSFE